MRPFPLPTITRKRLLTAAVLVLTLIVAGLLCAPFIARWAVDRALAAAGFAPATFEVQSVGLSGIHLVNLTIGTSPWLVASSVEVTYKLAELLSGRVRSIDVTNAQWTVQIRDGAINWGLVPKPSTEPITLDLPFDRLNLRESAIRMIVNDVAHEVPIAGHLALSAPDAIAGELTLVVMSRRVTLSTQAMSTADELTVKVDGGTDYSTLSATDLHAAAVPESNAAQARLNAALLRSHDDGSIQIDVTATLESLGERVGDIDIGIAQASVTGHAVLDGRGQLNDMTSSIILQDFRAGEVALDSAELTAVKLDGPELQLQAAASSRNWRLPEAHGTLRWDMNAVSVEEPSQSADLTIGMQTSKPVSLNWEASGITGSIDSIAGSMKVGVGGSGVRAIGGSLAMNSGSLQVGDLSFSDAHAEAVMRSPQEIDVTSFAATVGDGGTISAAPFTFNPRALQIQTRLSVSDLSLAQWLPLITGDRSTGQGRVSGFADVSIDWTTGAARLEQLSGSLRADPQHGFIQVTDADALGELLEAQDPRFATDEVMRSMRDKIVAALQDFAFNKLSVELSRKDDETVALAQVSGFGRHGQDPQGLNVTLDLHVQDAILDLASRIATRARFRKAAESSLDSFFQGAPNTEEANP